MAIAGNENITDDSVKVLAKCTNLRKLDLTFCTRVTMDYVLSFLIDIDKKSAPLSLDVHGTSVCLRTEYPEKSSI